MKKPSGFSRFRQQAKLRDSGGQRAAALRRRRLPANQRRAPGKPAAHGVQNQQLAGLKAPGRRRLGERQRDRGGRGVGVAIDRDQHPLARRCRGAWRRRRGSAGWPGAAPASRRRRSRGRPRRAPVGWRRSASGWRGGTPRGRSSADARWCRSRTARRRRGGRRSGGRRSPDGSPARRDRRPCRCRSRRAARPRPAPSPNRTQVERSCQSSSREKVSAPITSAELRAAGDEEAVGDRERVDEAAAHRLDVEGGGAQRAELALHRGRAGREGVVRRRGRDARSDRAARQRRRHSRSAARAAAVARSEVSSPSAAMWRWRMPVRSTIH